MNHKLVQKTISDCRIIPAFRVKSAFISIYCIFATLSYWHCPAMDKDLKGASQPYLTDVMLPGT